MSLLFNWMHAKKAATHVRLLLPSYWAVFCAGVIILARYWHVTIPLVAALMAAVVVGISLCANSPFHSCGKRVSLLVLLLCIPLGGLGVYLGYHSMYQLEWVGGSLPLHSINQVRGVMVSDSRAWGKGGRYLIRTNEIENQTTVATTAQTIYCYGREWHELYRGDLIHARVSLRESSSHIPDCYLDEIGILDTKDSASGYALRVGLFFSNFFSNARVVIRKEWGKVLNKFPKSSADLLKALLLGERRALSSVTRANFRKAGVSHLLALSGMHLAILVSLIGVITRIFCNIKITRIILIIAVICYLWVIGDNPSLARATIMVVLWSVLKMYGIKTPPINIVSCAFIIMVLIAPRTVNELSFQLSFSALTGIILISPVMHKFLRGYMPRWVSLPLSASISAQIFTLPFVLGYFNTLHPIGIVATMVLSPIVALYMWQALIWMPIVIFNIPVITEIGTTFSLVLATLIRNVAFWFSQAPTVHF